MVSNNNKWFMVKSWGGERLVDSAGIFDGYSKKFQ